MKRPIVAACALLLLPAQALCEEPSSLAGRYASICLDATRHAKFDAKNAVPGFSVTLKTHRPPDCKSYGVGLYVEYCNKDDEWKPVFPRKSQEGDYYKSTKWGAMDFIILRDETVTVDFFIPHAILDLEDDTSAILGFKCRFFKLDGEKAVHLPTFDRDIRPFEVRVSKGNRIKVIDIASHGPPGGFLDEKVIRLADEFPVFVYDLVKKQTLNLRSILADQEALP
jgi:hypothetical protein